MGASDLARYGYTYDDVPAGQSDPNLDRFSIAHDLADVVPLTKQAHQINPPLIRGGRHGRPLLGRPVRRGLPPGRARSPAAARPREPSSDSRASALT
jgi:hypothetical protein